MPNLPKAFRKARKAHMHHGRGQAWFYINATGIEIFVAPANNQPSTNCIRFTHAKLRKILEIAERETK